MHVYISDACVLIVMTDLAGGAHCTAIMITGSDSRSRKSEFELCAVSKLGQIRSSRVVQVH